MRIISGSHKGRKIIAPKKLPVRPTTDFAKEGLFNILRNRLDFSEIKVLDLFAGTGNIAYEFASRGCPDITCVDINQGCVKFIEKTSLTFEFPISVLKMDVFSFSERSNTSYDLIFADPPYAFEEDELKQLVNSYCTKKHLSEVGILILEHEKQKDLSNHPNFLESRRYGGSIFSFFSN